MAYGEHEQQEQEQTLIGEGSFIADLISWEYGYTKNDLPQLALGFRLVDGPDAGRMINAYRNFADKAIKHTLDAMTVLGWDGESLESPEGLGTKQVMLVIKHEEYQGKWSAKVQYINSLTRLNSKPMTQGDRSKFGASMKGALSAYKRERFGNAAPAGNGSRPAANGGKPAPGKAPARPPAAPQKREMFAYQGFMYWRDTNEPVEFGEGVYLKEGDPVPPEVYAPRAPAPKPGSAPASKPDDDDIPF